MMSAGGTYDPQTKLSLIPYFAILGEEVRLQIGLITLKKEGDPLESRRNIVTLGDLLEVAQGRDLGALLTEKEQDDILAEIDNFLKNCGYG
jgi:hypothetical protein